MTFKQTIKSFDYLLALAVIGLSVFSIFMIYASTNALSIQINQPLIANGPFASFWILQRTHVITGSLLMLVFAAIDYRFITRFYWVIYGVTIFLLLLALATGTDATATARWIRVPVPFVGFMSLQPSEFTKVFMILFLAKLLEMKQDKFNRITWLSLILITILVPVGLIVAQSALSAPLVVLVISLVILFTGGLYYRTIFIVLILTLPIAIAVWLDMMRNDSLFLAEILGEYQWRRIENFLRPYNLDDIRQTQGSLFAIGSAGLFGKGYLNNTYVIAGHNDFIFSVVAEQFGFVGGVVLLGVIAFIIIKCILIALRAEDQQGRLIAAGVAGMLIFETFVHVGVATDILPNTGMPFPFLSYGGSMIWSHMIAIGLVLNVGIPRTKSIFEEESQKNLK